MRSSAGVAHLKTTSIGYDCLLCVREKMPAAVLEPKWLIEFSEDS